MLFLVGMFAVKMGGNHMVCTFQLIRLVYFMHIPAEYGIEHITIFPCEMQVMCLNIGILQRLYLNYHFTTVL